MTDCNQVNWCLEILKVTPTFIIGCIALRIAWQQKETAKEQRKIAKAKLNLDLFTRRLEIFTKTWEAASSVSQTENPISAPISMTNLFAEASFLFDSDVEAYMKELAMKMNNLAIMRAQLQAKSRSNTAPPIHEDEYEEMNKLETWIFKAATMEIRNTFKRYLNFGEWH